MTIPTAHCCDVGWLFQNLLLRSLSCDNLDCLAEKGRTMLTTLYCLPKIKLKAIPWASTDGSVFLIIPWRTAPGPYSVKSVAPSIPCFYRLSPKLSAEPPDSFNFQRISMWFGINVLINRTLGVCISVAIAASNSIRIHERRVEAPPALKEEVWHQQLSSAHAFSIPGTDPEITICPGQL